jgi:hypothetical protein
MGTALKAIHVQHDAELLEQTAMNKSEAFSISECAGQAQLAERELSAFIAAVAELFGPEQARLSAEDWLEESELIDSPPRSTSRDWRAVTIAASARLACRLNVARHGAANHTAA